MKNELEGYKNISELKIDNNIKIISLSDIHGDIHSLIIALRDCADVIKKKKNFNFNNNLEDKDLEYLLNIDISEKEDTYIDDLNYEWIGKNTHIVIVGDFLDCKRSKNKIYKNNGFGQNEYPQIEIKIFKFINIINKFAQLDGGRIIKIFGNHEILNIIGNKEFIIRYSYSNTIKQSNYYKGFNRIDCFQYNNPGYKLMLEDNMYVLYKINNNIFVHGGPVDKLNFSNYNYLNYIINYDIKNKINDIFNNLSDMEISPLWTRIFGDFKLINNRIKNNNNCDFVKNIIKIIKGSNYFDDDIKNIRIILGHCVQSLSMIHNQLNITFSYINNNESNNIKEVLEPKLEKIEDSSKRIIPKKINYIYDNKLYEYHNNNDVKFDVKYRGYANLKDRIVFGITMECDKEINSLDSYIYKVDVGSSRGFDNMSKYKNNDENILSKEELENKYYLSRTPQILEIINNKPKIIRSLISNTKIHQPRILQQNLEIFYEYKYFKYKKKFNDLKKLINNFLL
jgi:hypothetical protein